MSTQAVRTGAADQQHYGHRLSTFFFAYSHFRPFLSPPPFLPLPSPFFPIPLCLPQYPFRATSKGQGERLSLAAKRHLVHCGLKCFWWGPFSCTCMKYYHKMVTSLQLNVEQILHDSHTMIQKYKLQPSVWVYSDNRLGGSVFFCYFYYVCCFFVFCAA